MNIVRDSEQKTYSKPNAIPPFMFHGREIMNLFSQIVHHKDGFINLEMKKTKEQVNYI